MLLLPLPAPPSHALPQYKTRRTLAEREGLSAEEREFMLEWNRHLRAHPVHADGELPDAASAFAAERAARLRGDTPFRRLFLAFLLNLWRFRLLTPQQVQQLTAELPPILLRGRAPAAAHAAAGRR